MLFLLLNTCVFTNVCLHLKSLSEVANIKTNKMSNLLEITHEGNFNHEETNVIISAEFEDYTLKALVDSDVQLDTAAEPDLGISDSYRQDGVDFFQIEVLDEMSQPMNLGPAELVSVKHEIENYLDGLVQSF